MRIALALLFLTHGIAHLPGFIVLARVATMKGMPYRTTILGGRIDVGDVGTRAIGLLWLLAAVAFVAVAIGLYAGAAWWRPGALGVAGFSLVLGILCWPEARIGVVINAAIIAFLLAGGLPG
ncbi:MAG TPA: ABC transporter permease [Candidatus Kapabacteria bacterium]|nr:ABC transporter permease [Candidatus Kapabacteria bacterium]